jgi:hypothetical protein
VSERTGQPALADAGRPDQQQALMLPDPVAAGELQEKIAIKTPGDAEVYVLDPGVMKELSGTALASKRFWRRVVASRSRRWSTR